MIFQLIGIVIIIYSFINYRKAFLWFMLYKLMLTTNITFLAIPGIPLLTVDDFLIMVFVLEYFVWQENKFKLYEENNLFPFKVPFVILCCSWGISWFFSIAGIQTALSPFVKNVLEYVVMTFLMWKIINTQDDLKFLLWGFTIMFLLFGVYELYEIASQSNPLADYEATLLSDDRAIDFGNYEADEYRGSRAKSVFIHPIGAGINFAIYIILLLTFLLRSKIQMKINKNLVIATCLLALVCVIMSKSRGPYLFLIIGVLGVIDLKNAKFYKYAVLLAILVMALLPYFSDQLDIFRSLYSEQAQQNVGGSDADMRIEQLEYALALLAMSPAYGLGFKYMQEVSKALTVGLLGGESVWFTVIPSFGIIGIFAYAFSIYWMCIKLPLQYKSTAIFFISLAYWLTSSLTSIPGCDFYLIYLAVILFIKEKQGVFVDAKVVNQ